MARRKKFSKTKPELTETSRKTKVELTETSSAPPVYEYKEPKVVEPKLKFFGAMYKDAGAGIVKYFKVTAKRDLEDNCSLIVKTGKLGDAIKTDVKEDFVNFEAACREAQDLISAKQKRGYKIK